MVVPEMSINTPVALKHLGFPATLFLAVLSLACVGSFAQEQNNPNPLQPDITLETVEALRKQAAGSAELDAEMKQKIEAACTAAQEGLKKIQDLNQLAEQFRQDAANVTSRVSELRDKLTILQKSNPSVPEGLEAPQLEQEVSQKEVTLSNLKTDLSKAEAEPTNRVSRRQKIRNFLLTYNQTLDTIREQLALAPPPNETPLLTAARQLAYRVEQMAILAEVPAVQNELNKYDAEDATDYVRLRRDVAARQVTLAEQELQAFQKALNKQRETDSKNKVKIAELAVLETPEPLRFAAQETVDFAKNSRDLAAPIQETNQKLDAARSQLEEIQKEFKLVEQRVNEIGLTGSIGSMLRRRQSELPDLRTLRKNVQERKSLIEEVQYQGYEYDDLRSKTFEEEKKRIIAELDSPTLAPAMEDAIKEVIDSRRATLDDVIRNYKSYVDALFDLDATEQLLIIEVEKFADFIDERVLWIRSSKPIYQSFGIDDSDLWIIDGNRWATVTTKYVNDFKKVPYLYGLAAILFAYLLWRKSSFRRVGVAYGSDVQQAKQLLRDICAEHPSILDEPKKIVTFEDFADSSLSLVVRTFLPDLENRLSVIDELHSTINEVFDKAGIEISFPQRDLHIRSVEPNLLTQMNGDQQNKSA